jgi:hypothetical protein
MERGRLPKALKLMPRRSILSATERESPVALPQGHDELIQHYTLNESDLALVRQRHGGQVLFKATSV